MARSYDLKRGKAAGSIPAQAERTLTSGLNGSSMSNSALLSALGYATKGPEAQAALGALRAQRPDAEAEADRLSAGIAASTPEAVKSEMGVRLGADLSPIRFHADAASERQGDRIAARAWTRGGDVYFGEGGFDPAVAAHELVHTVQQGAAEGQTAAAAPAGAVQMMPQPLRWIRDRFRKRNDSPLELDEPTPAQTSQLPPPSTPAPNLPSTQPDTPTSKIPAPPVPASSPKVTPTPAQTPQFVPPPSTPAPSLPSTQPDTPKFTPPPVTVIPQKAAPVDGTLNPKLNLRLPAASPTQGPQGQPPTAPAAQVPQGQSPALPTAGEREAAQQAQSKAEAAKPLSQAELKALQAKRPWEMTKADFMRDRFNPGQAKDVAEVQAKIYMAKTPDEAYRIFSRYAGNSFGHMVTQKDKKWTPQGVDLLRFKNKLMNMARMVHDYPELRGMIGNMSEIDPSEKAVMNTYSTRGGRQKVNIGYNPKYDSPGMAAKPKAAGTPGTGAHDAQPALPTTLPSDATPLSSYHNSGLAYAGNHELGHVLNSLLLKKRHRKDRNGDDVTIDQDWAERITADEMLQEVLREQGYRVDALPHFEEKGTHQHPSYPTRKMKHRKGQLDMKHSHLAEGSLTIPKPITSGYGQTDAAEFFAEAFADVYSNGEDAKPASIALVKKYEERRKAMKKK